MHALESAKPAKLRMPGLQEFAAAVSEGAMLITQEHFLYRFRMISSSAVTARRNHPAALFESCRRSCSSNGRAGCMETCQESMPVWCVVLVFLTLLYPPTGLGASAPHPLGHLQRPLGPHLHRCGPAVCTLSQ
jgi:hypothetical protein